MDKLNLKMFLGSLVLAVALASTYEIYRRDEGYLPGYDDNAEIWSYWRGQVDNLSAEDVIILGSSRAHFNINLHLFDSLTGHQPVSLAVSGGSPYHTFGDIVKNTDFNGLMIIGVAPGLFYSTGQGGPAAWVKADRVDFYTKQTYASKFSQWCYGFVDPYIGYLDPEISLKSLLTRINLPDRDSVNHDPAWPPFISMDWYRNVRLVPAMENDTVIQNRQTRIWDGDWKNHFADSLESVLHHYTSLVKEFRSRGGRVAFVQSPVTGKYLQHEPVLFPRETHWNKLLEQCECTGYHYEDYPEMKAMNPPEWSHLNRKESDEFTRILVRLLQQDGLLKP